MLKTEDSHLLDWMLIGILRTHIIEYTGETITEIKYFNL